MAFRCAFFFSYFDFLFDLHFFLLIPTHHQLFCEFLYSIFLSSSSYVSYRYPHSPPLYLCDFFYHFHYSRSISSSLRSFCSSLCLRFFSSFPLSFLLYFSYLIPLSLTFITFYHFYCSLSHLLLALLLLFLIFPVLSLYFPSLICLSLLIHTHTLSFSYSSLQSIFLFLSNFVIFLFSTLSLLYFYSLWLSFF